MVRSPVLALDTNISCYVEGVNGDPLQTLEVLLKRARETRTEVRSSRALRQEGVSEFLVGSVSKRRDLMARISSRGDQRAPTA